MIDNHGKTNNVPGTLFYAPTWTTVAWVVDDEYPEDEMSLGDIENGDVAIFICRGIVDHDVYLTKYGVCHLSDAFLKFAINANVE